MNDLYDVFIFDDIENKAAHPQILFSLSDANEPVHEKTNNFGFPTSSDTNQSVHLQNKAKLLKLWI